MRLVTVDEPTSENPHPPQEQPMDAPEDEVVEKQVVIVFEC